MIRMGRSSNQDDNSNNTSALHQQSSTTALAQNTAKRAETNGVVTESESMARDIKEGKLSGFVGAGTELTGDTTFQSLMRVDGHLTGRVSSSEGTLIIGCTGQVDADVEVSSAIVSGTVNGDITVTEKVELGRGARVVGNITAPRLIVEDGALIEGSCNMVKSKESFDAKQEQQRQYITGELSPQVGEEEFVEEEVVEEEELDLSSEADNDTLEDDSIEETILEDDSELESILDDDHTAEAATI